MPTLSLSGALPAGVSFTAERDGTAQISGSPQKGTAGTYPLVLTLTNPAGSTTQGLTFTVDQPPNLKTATSTAGTGAAISKDVVFSPGVATSTTVTVTGSPAPTLTLTTRVGPEAPSWLTVTIAGDAVHLSGTAPETAVGSPTRLVISATSDVGGGGRQIGVVVQVPFRLATAHLGVAYTTHLPSGHTYTLNPTQTVPSGLTLSTTGTLSGTATQYTTSSFLVSATGGATVLVEVGVHPPVHALEVTEFRTSGPMGPGDWFAEVSNTTPSGISLAGWALKMAAAPPATPAPSTWATPALPTTPPLYVSLGTGTLAPGQSVLVAGPRFSGTEKRTEPPASSARRPRQPMVGSPWWHPTAP